MTQKMIKSNILVVPKHSKINFFELLNIFRWRPTWGKKKKNIKNVCLIFWTVFYFCIEKKCLVKNSKKVTIV